MAVSVAFSQAPAPSTDRVGFPANYRDSFKHLLTVDRSDNGQIRSIWANESAANTPWWLPYPYGSVILFESWTSKRDAQGNLMIDENGRLMPDQLTTLFVKRKEPDFGEAYRQNRNGEWEYIAYRPDGTVQTAPQNTGNCAICHLQAGPPQDWTFRRLRFANGASGVTPQATMSQYSFIPRDLRVKKGTRVTWYNDDEIEHQILIPQFGAFSNVMPWGGSFSHLFAEAGEYEIRCSIHAGMRAKIIVEP